MENCERVCPFCNSTFDKLDNLKFHMDTEHFTMKQEDQNGKERKAPTNGSAVSNKQRNKSTEEHQKYQCDLCHHKIYGSREGLKNHKKIVHNGERYSCIKCPKVYTRLFLLKTHVQNAHEETKKNVCKTCQKSFLFPKNLVVHVQAVHEGIRYTCDNCGKSFSNEANLKRHDNVEHKGIGHKCELCGKIFPSDPQLWTHLQKKH